MSAEILCIGTELLLGNITNGNARWIAEQLAALGIAHHRQLVVGDNRERLIAELRAAAGVLQDLAQAQPAAPACEPVQSLRCKLESLDRLGPRTRSAAR